MLTDTEIQRDNLVTSKETISLSDANNSKAQAICLVDDDQSVLKATNRLLSSAGWKVESFTDPIAFLRFAQMNRPPLVILDILMPVMNGFKVQTELRRLSPSTRVIILTSKDDLLVRSQAMEAGASAFFVKPVGDTEFLAGVESAFSEN
jgi:FixJ family two-component response regulator